MSASEERAAGRADGWSRRAALAFGGAAAVSAVTPFTGAGTPAAAQDAEQHGISGFGDLKYPADFKQFDYVNPTAPKGGNWVDAQVDPRTNIDIENAILTRARQLRIAGGS